MAILRYRRRVREILQQTGVHSVGGHESGRQTPNSVMGTHWWIWVVWLRATQWTSPGASIIIYTRDPRAENEACSLKPQTRSEQSQVCAQEGAVCFYDGVVNERDARSL